MQRTDSRSSIEASNSFIFFCASSRSSLSLALAAKSARRPSSSARSRSRISPSWLRSSFETFSCLRITSFLLRILSRKSSISFAFALMIYLDIGNFQHIRTNATFRRLPDCPCLFPPRPWRAWLAEPRRPRGTAPCDRLPPPSPPRLSGVAQRYGISSANFEVFEIRE